MARAAHFSLGIDFSWHVQGFLGHDLNIAGSSSPRAHGLLPTREIIGAEFCDSRESAVAVYHPDRNGAVPGLQVKEVRVIPGAERLTEVCAHIGNRAADNFREVGWVRCGRARTKEKDCCCCSQSMHAQSMALSKVMGQQGGAEVSHVLA